MLSGMDVSNNNGTINWSYVPLHFAFCKATEGLHFRDSYLQRNREGCNTSGIVFGSYHFAQPTQSSGADQAKFYLDYTQPQPGELLALDLETPQYSIDLDAFTLDFLQTCENETGCKPFLYSANYYIRLFKLRSTELASYPLWLASWQNTLPPTPAPWDSITVWQYDDHGHVPGVLTEVDLDYFIGNGVDELSSFGVPMPSNPDDNTDGDS